MGEQFAFVHPLRYIFDWFQDVNPSGYGWGPIKVSNLEIEAYARNHGIKIRPWEVDVIVDLSIANIEVYNFKQNNPNLPKGYVPVTSVEGVKSMFSARAKKGK